MLSFPQTTKSQDNKHLLKLLLQITSCWSSGSSSARPTPTKSSMPKTRENLWPSVQTNLFYGLWVLKQSKQILRKWTYTCLMIMNRFNKIIKKKQHNSLFFHWFIKTTTKNKIPKKEQTSTNSVPVHHPALFQASNVQTASEWHWFNHHWKRGKQNKAHTQLGLVACTMPKHDCPPSPTPLHVTFRSWARFRHCFEEKRSRTTLWKPSL